MAAKQTKADIIRKYLANNPDVGPTELAKKIMQENKGYKVSPTEVSTYRGKMKSGATAGKNHVPRHNKPGIRVEFVSPPPRGMFGKGVAQALAKLRSSTCKLLAARSRLLSAGRRFTGSQSPSTRWAPPSGNASRRTAPSRLTR